jgi:hypothetical protein
MPEFAQYLGACCRSATNRRRIRGFFDTLLRKTVLTGRVRAFLARRGRPTHDPLTDVDFTCIFSVSPYQHTGWTTRAKKIACR